MRTKAFGHEPPDSLLESEVVARASLETMLAPGTGHVIDLRRIDPLAGGQDDEAFAEVERRLTDE